MSDLLFCFLFRGGLQLAIDAELLLQKGALVTIRVCHAKGMVEVKFTKEPFSHWSLSLLPVSDGMDVFCNVIHAAMFGPWPMLQNYILVSYERNVNLPIFWTYTTVRTYILVLRKCVYLYLQDPPADIKLSVTAEVEGRNLNHLAKFIEMQVCQSASIMVVSLLVFWYLWCFYYGTVLHCHSRYTEPFVGSILCQAERHVLNLYFPVKYLFLVIPK